MNYIELIKRFWELDRIYSFNGNETRLYFYLVEQANCLCWQEWFWHKDELASAYVGMSRDTLRSCRNKLKQCGLIDFIPGGNGQRNKTRYEILAPKADPKPDPNGNPKLYPKPDPLNKQKTETKTITPLLSPQGDSTPSVSECPAITTEDCPPGPTTAPASKQAPPDCAAPPRSKKSAKLDTSFVAPEFAPIVEEWLAYKAERGQSYRPTGFKACYTRLVNLSRGDPATARQIVEEAMANNWGGFFELKPQINTHDTRTTDRRTLPNNPVYRSDDDF
ncbi:hypothetical protein [Millionella massiliensis]|uniref:hypothetical protein n=1 Tax=Millionella massiliensis TaxID=1871023 RepID=UPI0023A844F2|nr:hypothetical protein [Millionella massiliensis]